jgi:hypothetical protein
MAPGIDLSAIPQDADSALALLSPENAIRATLLLTEGGGRVGHRPGARSRGKRDTRHREQACSGCRALVIAVKEQPWPRPIQRVKRILVADAIWSEDLYRIPIGASLCAKTDRV